MILQCSVLSDQCWVISVQWSVCSDQCTVFSVKWLVCDKDCAVFSVECAVCSDQCTMFNVQWSVCSWRFCIGVTAQSAQPDESINSQLSSCSMAWQTCLHRMTSSWLCKYTTNTFICKPGRSQGLLYKQLCHWLNNWFSHPFPHFTAPPRPNG